MAVAFRVALVAVLFCACSETTPSPGSLTVTISGLPSGTAADVTVTPPGQHLTATTTIGNLAPGAYTITAAAVSGYAATVTGSPATVVAGQTAAASVTYALAATTGSLTVSVSGLPGGTDGDVTVAGPGGFSQHLAATQTLSALTPGSYTVTAQAAGSYQASVSGSPATVTAGQTASAAVTYSLPPTTGSLSVAVTGLSGAINADIDVAGPASYSHHLTAAATLTGLAPGSYTITAHDIAGYTATGASGSPATVVVGQTASATVTTRYTFEFVTPIGAVAALLGPGFSQTRELTGTAAMPCLP